MTVKTVIFCLLLIASQQIHAVFSETLGLERIAAKVSDRLHVIICY